MYFFLLDIIPSKLSQNKKFTQYSESTDLNRHSHPPTHFHISICHLQTLTFLPDETRKMMQIKFENFTNTQLFQ